jgi:F-type H+-transporting ATPase subunit b
VIFPDYTFLIQWANFILLIVLLNFLLYRPIIKRMEERDKAIRGNLEEAAADRAEAEKRMADYEEAIAAARRQGLEQMGELEQEVSAEVRGMMDEKRVEAGRMTEAARAQIENQSREAERSLEAHVRELAAAISRRVAGREINV